MATPALTPAYKAPTNISEMRQFAARLMQDLANGRITLYEANAQCRLMNIILRTFVVQYLHQKMLGIAQPSKYLKD
jgi:hypothetical protein